MNFNVKYRTSDGSIAYLDIEADSKSSVFQILKGRGINAISVTQGASKTVKHSSKRSPKIFVAFFLVFVAILGAYLFYTNVSVNEKVDTPPKKFVQKTNVKHVVKKESGDRIIVPSGKKRPARKLTVDRKSAVSTPNLSSNSIVVTYGMVKGKSIFKRPVFKHNSENLICAVLQTTPGTRIIDIPLGKRFEEDFAASFASPIRVEEGDTPEEVELKQLMVDVKAELVDRVKNGENLSEIIENARKDINKLAQYNEDVRRAYFEMRNSAKSIEEVEEFRLAANKLLEERGIPPIQAAKRGKYKVDRPLDAPMDAEKRE